jgi:putative transposase
MNTITQFGQETSMPIDSLCTALGISRATYYRHINRVEPQQDNSPLREASPPKQPENALSKKERQGILDLLHSDQFIDKTPYEAYYELLDRGEYHGSIRTMYRVLDEQGESRDRRIQRNHRDAVKPELIATRSNEVWSWDITKLLGPQKWVYFHLYVIMDIFSRYVVGWLIADRECKKLARLLIQKSALKHGIQPSQLTLHSDNGPSMTSLTVAQLLNNLGVAKTHNRPYTSNDNPFSESQFKTLKYRPEFPVRFQSIASGEAFCQHYFDWYNKEHYHSGIAWLTPESVHFGRSEAILQKRYDTMQQAFLNNPRRFNNQPPKLQELPSEVYINPPQTVALKQSNLENKRPLTA